MKASTCLAPRLLGFSAPRRRRTKYSSINVTLSGVTKDFGHSVRAIPFLAQTGDAFAPAAQFAHPQFRFFSRPDFRHASHLQPAWLED